MVPAGIVAAQLERHKLERAIRRHGRAVGKRQVERDLDRIAARIRRVPFDDARWSSPAASRTTAVTARSSGPVAGTIDVGPRAAAERTLESTARAQRAWHQAGSDTTLSVGRAAAIARS